MNDKTTIVEVRFDKNGFRNPRGKQIEKFEVLGNEHTSRPRSKERTHWGVLDSEGKLISTKNTRKWARRFCMSYDLLHDQGHVVALKALG
jgi:hypothetical protein